MAADGRRAMSEEKLGLVVVSGASTGIGEATARGLAAHGFDVIAGVRNSKDADRLGSDPSGRIAPTQLDVTVASDISALVALVATRSAHGLRGLVNNAGVAIVGPIEALEVADWRRQLEVNVIGQVALTRGLLPALLQGRGSVVNVSSIGGLVAGPLFGPYAASKFALEAFTDVLRREVAALGVAVVAIEPGAIATPIWTKGRSDAEARIDTSDPQVEARYAHLIDAARTMGESATRNGLPPSAVAQVILKAITAARPRTRYLVGRDAKIQARLSRMLPDRAMDALIRRALN